MSFGKIHGSFFDSSVNELHTIARFVFIGMIVLSDRDGRLDVTRQALARKLNLDLADVDEAIGALEQPDTESRGREADGRRIVPLDASRSWGWLIVNKAQYRNRDVETIRESNRQRKAEERRRRRGFPSPSPTEENQQIQIQGVTHCHPLSRKERDSLFEEIWKLVPRKEEKPDARKWFAENVRDTEAAERIRSGVLGYREKLKAEGTAKQFWKQGNTLFRHAEGFIGWTPPADIQPEGQESSAIRRSFV